MTRVIRLRRGLDINLAGRAEKTIVALKPDGTFALRPDSFEGIKPKVLVKEGDKVKAGEALFINKAYPNVKFSSPVSGTVSLVERGDRRKLLSVRIEADKEQEFIDFGVKDIATLSGEQVVENLLEAGLFGYINQLPYAISTNPETKPKAIFVSALRDMPLAGDFEFELQGQKKDFQAGLTALSRIAKTYLGIGSEQNITVAGNDVEVVKFSGKCPAGNVGVQVNHIDPVNKGEVVWTVDPTAVIFFGRLFNTGKVDLRRTVALAGSEVTSPHYTEMLVGQNIDTLLNGAYDSTKSVRIIMGNPLTGKPVAQNSSEEPHHTRFLGAHTSEITIIPEGDKADEFAGWIMPRLGQFSVSRSYFSWLLGRKKEYKLDARIKGGERHIIMSGEYDSVLPMDIYGEYLIKAIITGDIDKQEQLGIYEVSPEDFALAEFVDSSKLELQRIVREGLDVLRKENE
ncbi:Na(+)-translocating NADH-quinone reductase subunit A [uncultured Prevotella sp.]|uniref:Na(+)-translocating NADH-quinone reductase subunit A n=1 Tax=uncultured Prevotella sp. TaxID=159272 RepID=UPI00261A0E92|nr:Na(+)-translocating NADH-quinone reductase subunit A [uncultured Prevotella sp.]